MCSQTIESDPEVRLKIPRSLWQLIEETAQIMKVTPRVTLKQFVVRLGLLVERGEVEAFGPEYTKALKQLRVSKRLIDDVKQIPIDITKLHRSKIKSGFEGVYATDSGFSAQVDHIGKGQVQVGGYFDTATHAAQARLEYCLEHHLPYGEAATELSQYRERYPEMSIGALIDLIDQTRISTTKLPLCWPDKIDRSFVQDPDHKPLTPFGFHGELP